MCERLNRLFTCVDAVVPRKPIASNRNEPDGSVARDAQVQVHQEPAAGGLGGVRLHAEQTGKDDKDATTRNRTTRGKSSTTERLKIIIVINRRGVYLRHNTVINVLVKILLQPCERRLFCFTKKINEEAVRSRDKTRLVLQKKETNAANIAKFRMKQIEQIR